MQSGDILNGAAAAASHPLTVQVINQGPGIWGNVATGLITAGAAIAAVMLTHRFTLRREKLASEDKQHKERYFIATELVFLLEKIGEDCVPPATDYGEAEDEYGLAIPGSRIPDISFSGITGDWRSLPPLIMYRLRELEKMSAESRSALIAAHEDDAAPHYVEYFFRRRQWSVSLGLRAFLLAARLRKLCRMPSVKTANNWSAPERLWEQYREQRSLLAESRRSNIPLECLIIKMNR